MYFINSIESIARMYHEKTEPIEQGTEVVLYALWLHQITGGVVTIEGEERSQRNMKNIGCKEISDHCGGIFTVLRHDFGHFNE